MLGGSCMRSAIALEPVAMADDSFAAVDELLEMTRPKRLVLPKHTGARNTLAWIIGSWIALALGVAGATVATHDLRPLFGPSAGPVHQWRSVMERSR